MSDFAGQNVMVWGRAMLQNLHKGVPMLRFASVAALIGLSACIPDPRPPSGPSIDAVHERHISRLAEANRFVDANTAWAICDNPPKPGKSCGLIADEAPTGPAQERWISENCPGSPMATCYRLYAGLAKQRMRARYDLADEAEVERFCAQAPEKCAGLDLWELQLMKNHNAHVEAQWRVMADRASKDSRAGYARALAEHERYAQESRDAESKRASIRAMGQAMHDSQPVRVDVYHH